MQAPHDEGQMKADLGDWSGCRDAGAKGYYAVVLFQQIASIGNNISIQIVAGISMKVRQGSDPE